jgi:chromosome segregation ATPase
MTSPPKWDAFKVLAISSRHDASTTCVGITKLSNRCRWSIADDRYQEIRSVLNSIEQKPPDIDALNPILRKLAPLCLCQEQHQWQVGQAIAKWKTLLSDFVNSHEFSSSQALSAENETLQKKLKEEVLAREGLSNRIEDLSLQLLKQREKCTQWIETCSEAEAAKERLLILVNKRGKEVAKAEREVERLERVLGVKGRELEEERKRKGEEIEEKANVEELRKRLEEQGRVERVLVESLEEVRKGKAAEVIEMETLKTQLATKTEESRKALDEAKNKEIELLGQIESLNAQILNIREASEQLQRDLDTSVKLNSEQSALAATQASAHADEVSQLREQIGDLEKQISLSFSKKLGKKMKRAVKGFGTSIGVPGSTRLVFAIEKREKKSCNDFSFG